MEVESNAKIGAAMRRLEKLVAAGNFTVRIDLQSRYKAKQKNALDRSISVRNRNTGVIRVYDTVADALAEWEVGG